ncbi:hypothetical protein K8I61_19035 [bacterium]|nr:hypothetical protein [bacterium]
MTLTRHRFPFAFLAALAALALSAAGCGCGDDDDDDSSDGGDDDAAGDDDDGPAGYDEPIPDDLPAEVPQFGDDETRKIVVIGTADDGLDVPRDLDFDPERPGRLWTVNRATDGTVIYFDAGSDEQTSDEIIDRYANHFMEEVSSIAFGAPGTFATCQESRNTYNGQAEPNDFMGPALWPSDLDVYAAVHQFDNLLGSHLDMLHESPLCMGIEHDTANVYWVFDGMHGNIVRYDFKEDHGPGYDDHSDGIVRRYTEIGLTREPDVPGHLAMDDETRWMYVADTGAARVVRFDTESGAFAGDLSGAKEPLAEYSEYRGANHETFVDGGFETPCGVAVHEGIIFVSDYETGDIAGFDVTGAEIDRVNVGAGVMGIEIGPDGRLWFVNADENTVSVIEP